MNKIQEDLQESIPTPYQVKQAGMHPHEFYAQQCRMSDGFFPHIATSLSQNNPQMIAPKDLVRAMEEPIPLEQLSELERAAWDYHFDDYGVFFELYLEQLVLMESWLRAEAKYKHGGRRTPTSDERPVVKESGFEVTETKWWTRYLCK